MKKWLLTLVLMLVAGPSVAGDSGLYYDEQRNGEGILVLVDGTKYVTYFFTYGGLECYEDDNGPKTQGISGDDCDLNGQRWFYGSDDFDFLLGQVAGTLYMAHGILYPIGEPVDNVPFVHNVGKSVAVGSYILRPNGEGFLMDVAPSGEVLDKFDPLYENIYIFRKVLFKADESVGPTPK